jgi:hypothetical protein
MTAWWRTGGIVVLFLGASALLLHAADPGKPPGPLQVEPEDLRPGLVALYRSTADPATSLARIDAKPAFSLGHSSPHPRIPPGPFEVVWTGVVLVKDPGPITFDARLCGVRALSLKPGQTEPAPENGGDAACVHAYGVAASCHTFRTRASKQARGRRAGRREIENGSERAKGERVSARNRADERREIERVLCGEGGARVDEL